MKTEDPLTYTIRKEDCDRSIEVEVLLAGERGASPGGLAIRWRKMTTKTVRQILLDEGHEPGDCVRPHDTINNGSGPATGTWGFVDEIAEREWGAMTLEQKRRRTQAARKAKRSKMIEDNPGDHRTSRSYKHPKPVRGPEAEPPPEKPKPKAAKTTRTTKRATTSTRKKTTTKKS
jgi:hypothetical protein